MSERFFLINVGANCSHGALRSPIFDNGQFRFVPIPETRVDGDGEGIVPRYYQLDQAKELIPSSYLDRCAHNDPEFDTYTYGDYPMRSPRSAVLRYAREGDHFFFLARLVRYTGVGFARQAGFYLIGTFCISDVLRNVTGPLDPIQFSMFGNNAHVKRAMVDSNLYDGFWIFKGGPESKRFERAIPFDRAFCKIVRDSHGQEWVWRRNKSELQTIGSYTRSCRLIDRDRDVRSFLDRIDMLQRSGTSVDTCS